MKIGKGYGVKAFRRSVTAFFLILFWGVVSAQTADAQSASLEALYLMRLINEARTAPAAMLERAGLDKEAARKALGPDAWILETGLPPLAPNDKLMAAASAHLDDMVGRLYYSTVNPEGLGPAERAAAAGYEAAAVSESLGLLAVVTFVSGPEAVWLVFRQWLQEELSAPPEARRLLALWPSDGGAAFRAVSVDVDGVRLNAYVAVADYGAAPVFQPLIVGTVRAPGASGPFLDPWVLPPPTTVRCRAEDGTLWWETLTDMLGGFLCPMVPGQWVAVEALRVQDGAVVAAVSVPGAEGHRALDLFP